MQPVSFNESNDVLDIPEGMSPEDVHVLSAWKGILENGQKVLVTCWKPTAEELAEIQKTGRVWLMALGHTIPPVHICGYDPFDHSKPQCNI